MRPSVDVNDAEEYECLQCGVRTTDPDGRGCTDCGGTLRSLGRERDL